MKLGDNVETLRRFKRSQNRVDTWFYVQEIKMVEREAMRREGIEPDDAYGNAELLCRVVAKMPLSLPEGSVIAGSQDGAFSPSYALINPNFKVEEFAGYCDPCAVYDDIEAQGDVTPERIETVRNYWKNTDYVAELEAIADEYSQYTAEVAFFMEPVTGHTIPDPRPFLKHGVAAMRQKALDSGTAYGKAMARSLDAVSILARRYRDLARDADMAAVLDKVAESGADNLREAVQGFALLWQVMVLEQAPNPYAFSVGNLDRIFQPYYDGDFESAVELIRHLLCFYQVGNRCWAISQNVMVGGRDEHGRDLTTPMTDVVLEAFFRSNDPQPALSVKLHSGTPDAVYENLNRFFFTPGHLTPSLFNDDSLFPMLAKQGVDRADLKDYAIAGCQEPLIMGKASLNTTNTWLNLGKVLELTLNDGRSTLSGKQILPTWQQMGLGEATQVYHDAATAFFRYLDYALPLMARAGNSCTTLLGKAKPVPFTSSLMDSLTSFRDMRDPENPGVRHNASGCLIHGLGVVADSLTALQAAVDSGMWRPEEIRNALQTDFASQPQLKAFLAAQPKYANNDPAADSSAASLAADVSKRVSALKNPAGRPFLADWSTPSTHLLYGYWVGATPDGRNARTMLGYGVDPRPEAVVRELPERLLSYHKLPFHLMTGGYASHIGLSSVEANLASEGSWMRDHIVRPLFRFGDHIPESPYYVYFNIDTPDHLRAILKSPRELAPSGVYIMRIHGTFVNFLDLSPAIQEDIIARLDLKSRAA
jgi:formate C-acetyltransferase